MATANNTIESTISAEVQPTQDFSYLRAQGLSYIQQMATALWTDHNLHDPGITILEVLCYALSDLGFRLNFPMRDMLTESNGFLGTQDALHIASDILMAAPLTKLDYRKVLIDIKGVQNAWLFTADLGGLPFKETGSPEIFAWCKESKLLYESQLGQITDPVERSHVQNTEQVRIQGLYAVKVALDEHPVYGDLNSSVLEYHVKDGVLKDLLLEVEFPKYTSSPYDDFYSNVTFSILNVTLINDTKLPYAQFIKLKRTEWKLTIAVKYGDKQLVLSPILLRSTKHLSGGKLTISGEDLINNLSGQLGQALMHKYRLRPQQIIEKVKEVRSVLQRNRNLCEDFLWDVALVDTEGLVLCADIDVETTADLEDIQAQIFVAIEEYLMPAVRFHSLGELLEEGLSTDEIFEGPALHNGFIKDETLEASELKEEYYLSDIVSIIMDVPGVLNVKNFSLRVTDANGNTKASGQLWKIPVSVNHKLLLNRRKTKFLFFKNTLPLLANYAETLNKMKLYATLQNQRKNNSDNELPLPIGKYRNLDKHYTLLDEFPAVYGIGKKRLPEPQTPMRKAQVRQLEGYLLFFDQLLANYFRQLYKVKDILSWKATEEATLYGHYFYTDAQGNHNEVAQNLLIEAEGLKTADLQKMVQTEAQYLDHKNRLLDHLISRFAESFNEYALHMYALPDDKVISDKEVSKLLIDQKRTFLKNYPSVSAQRAKAFDYTLVDTDLWNSVNISGFEKRIRGLLGMSHQHRKKLQALPEDELEGGFHMFEHLLLRPTSDKDPLLSICIGQDCHHCTDEDPYSFKISIVFPFWLKRFKNNNFRDYIERTLRREAPAHVLLRICWVNQTQMAALESAYEAWLLQKQLYYSALPNITTTTQENHTKALSDLAAALEGLRTEFEVGTLHNCDDKQEENDSRIRLGYTNLGTFNPIEDEQ